MTPRRRLPPERDPGFRASAASVTVSVNAANNQAPVVTITAPSNHATFFQGSAVTFTGSGTDAEDGARALSGGVVRLEGRQLGGQADRARAFELE